MIRSRLVFSSLIAVAVSFSVNLSGPWGVPQAVADEKPDPSKMKLSAKAGKPLIEAQGLMKEKKFDEALAKLKTVDEIPDKTPYDIFILEQLRGISALNAGNLEQATKSFEIEFASGFMPPADQIPLLQALAVSHYNAKNYAKAAEYAQRYFKNGGTDPSVRVVLTQSQFFNGDYAAAVKELNAELEANDKAGKPPSEASLQILANCYLKLKDDDGYMRVLERFVANYPKPEFWSELLNRLQRKQGANSPTQLDFYRLRNVTGSVREAGDYTDMAQLALQAGLPAEAKKAVDDGYAAGVLGTGSHAAADKKQRDTIAKQVAEDEKFLAKNPDAGAKTADAMVNVGYAYVTSGKADKGIALMEKGIAKGGLKTPNAATLHLALAYNQAGNKAKALELLKSVQGTDGFADLARVWVIYLSKN